MGSGLVRSDGAANSGGAAPGAAEHSAEDRGRCPSGAAPLRSTGREPSVTPPQRNAERGLCFSLNNGIIPSVSTLGFFFLFSLKRNKPKKCPASAAFSFRFGVNSRRKWRGGGHEISTRSVLRLQLLLFCGRGWAGNFHPGRAPLPVPLVGRITPQNGAGKGWGTGWGETPMSRPAVGSRRAPPAGLWASPHIALLRPAWPHSAPIVGAAPGWGVSKERQPQPPPSPPIKGEQQKK